jgi:hypothetical protein
VWINGGGELLVRRRAVGRARTLLAASRERDLGTRALIHLGALPLGRSTNSVRFSIHLTKFFARKYGPEIFQFSVAGCH